MLGCFPDLNGYLVKRAALKLGSGKSCSEDLVVGEMLQCLDEDTYDEIAQSFRMRILNHVSEDDDDVWDSHDVSLILKKVAPTSPGMLRHIALVSCLYKLFCLCQQLLLGPMLEDLSEYQFAFRPKRQCGEVIFMLRQLCEKTNEWQMPIFILDGDLPKAYDNTGHGLTARRLVHRGFPMCVVASIIRETRRSKCHVKLGSLRTEAIVRGKSLCQGSSDAPKIFNHVIDEDIVAFVSMCQSKGWGYPIENDLNRVPLKFLPILVFADNFLDFG